MLTLKAPLLVTLDDQAEKLPDSNPSAKIRSGGGVGVKVGVRVGEAVKAAVEVRVGVDV